MFLPEQLHGRENLQLESEKELFNLLHEQALISASTAIIQEDNSYAEVDIRSRLLEQLDFDSWTIKELAHLCHRRLDSKIQKATNKYLNE